jgi:hypothetical protein
MGTAPMYTTFWSDVDPVKTGWKGSTIPFDGLRLPFISYENEYLIWYAGWQWSGVLASSSTSGIPQFNFGECGVSQCDGR